MTTTLPKLQNYVTVPDYYPHCEICGYRGVVIADFLHTNYKGAIYECTFCDEAHLFIDREDTYFSIDYWNMNQKNRKIYLEMTDSQRRVFATWAYEEKKEYLKMTEKERKYYMKKAISSFYL